MRSIDSLSRLSKTSVVWTTTPSSGLPTGGFLPARRPFRWDWSTRSGRTRTPSRSRRSSREYGENRRSSKNGGGGYPCSNAWSAEQKSRTFSAGRTSCSTNRFCNTGCRTGSSHAPATTARAMSNFTKETCFDESRYCRSYRIGDRSDESRDRGRGRRVHPDRDRGAEGREKHRDPRLRQLQDEETQGTHGPQSPDRRPGSG